MSDETPEEHAMPGETAGGTVNEPVSDSRFVAVVRFAFRSAKRIAITAVGGVLVLGGIAMLVLPGPGILVVVAGFAVLGLEYAWAAAALDRTKGAAETAGRMAKDTAGRAGRAAKGTAGTAGRVVKGAATDPLRRRRGGS